MEFEPNKTAFLKKQKRTRARITLPMEMLAFSLLLVNALAAGLGYGLIGKLLVEQGSDLVWLCTSTPIAIAGLALVMFEWFGGEKWDDDQVRLACFARKWIGLAAIVMWLFLFRLIVSGADAVVPALGQCVMSTIFHGWAVLLCKRTYVILTDGYDTRKLEANLERNRLAT